jgi:cytochrome b involved in lipid metabolism
MTTNKKLSLVLGIIVIVTAGTTAIVQNLPSAQSPSVTVSEAQPASSTTVSGGQTASTSVTYTLAEVAEHNSGTSCWTAINGGVYDVTTWINQHPGGPEHILALCGTDGSAAFNGQHGGEARPAAELATFKIGMLAQ